MIIIYNSKDMIVDHDLTFLSYNQTINDKFTINEIIESDLWDTDYAYIFEDVGVTGNKNSYWVNQGNNFSVDTDSTGTTLTEINAGNYTPSNVADSTNWNDHLIFSLGTYVEFDIVNVNHAMFRVYYGSFSTQTTFVLKTGHYKFFVDEGVIKFWFDGEEQRKIENSDIQGSLIFSFVASNEGVTSRLKYKNFRIYESNNIKAIPLFNCDKIVSNNSNDIILDDNKCTILENNNETIINCISDDTGGIHYYNIKMYAFTPYSVLSSFNEIYVYCVIYDKYLNTINNAEVSVIQNDKVVGKVLTNGEGICKYKLEKGGSVSFQYGIYNSNTVNIHQTWLKIKYNLDYITIPNVSDGQVWLVSDGDVLINWGDGTNTKVNNPVSSLTQYYHDEKSEHLIEFIGEISKIGFGCFASNEGVLEVEISENITDIGNNCFVHCINLTKCNLYWIGDNIVDYTKLYSNDDTIYVIPKGETDNYIMKGYPSNNLIERGG